MLRLVMLSLAVFVLTLTVSSLSAALQYTEVYVDPCDASLPSTYRAINNMGQMVGWTATFGGANRAFIWEKGTKRYLGDTWSPIHEAYGLNDLGQVVGRHRDADGWMVAYLWDDNTTEDLGTLGGRSSEAYAINDAGQVVGKAQVTGGDWHAFLWQDWEMIDLGTLGGSTSEAYDINSSGQVVGRSKDIAGRWRAFIWQDGVMTDLGTPQPYMNSQAWGINDSGQVVGSCSGAVVWQNGQMTDLSNWPEYSAAYEINNSGWIAGSIGGGKFDDAALWDPEGNQIDLASELGYDPHSTSITYAADINDRGWVITPGYCTDDEGYQSPMTVLLVPPEPPVLVSLSPDSGRIKPSTWFTLTAKYYDPNWNGDMVLCRLMLRTDGARYRQIGLDYDAYANKLILADEDSNAVSAGIPGADGFLKGKWCRVDCSKTTITRSGPDLTVSWHVMLKPPVAGKGFSAWMSVLDDGGLMDGWDRMGSYTVK